MRPLSAAACFCLLALALAGCGGCGSDDSDQRDSIGGQRPEKVEVGDNVVRIPGRSPSDLASEAVLNAYSPAKKATPPQGWILVPERSWHEAVIGAQFAAKPVAAGVLPLDRGYVPPGPLDVMGRVKVRGFPKSGGLQAVVLGRVRDDVFADLQDANVKLTQLEASSPARLTLDAVPFRGGWAKEYSSNVVVVPSEEAGRPYGLIAAAWSAYSGDTIAFVSSKGIPEETASLLAQREKLRLEKPTMYVVGPPSLIPRSVVSQLGAYGTVKRVPGKSVAETAVEFALYKDAETGFGWGLDKGPVSVSLANAKHWANAIGAFTYAATGPQAPLLLTESAATLPPAVETYLRDAVKPSQAFVFGNAKSISDEAVDQIDAALSSGT